MLYQLAVRFAVLYILHGFAIVASVIIALNILKRSRKREMVIFSIFYIIVAIALGINIVYAHLTDPGVVRILNSLTNYLTGFALIFFTVFTIILYKGKEKFDTKKQIGLITIYGLLLSAIFFIPNGVEISAETNWLPIWSWTLFIYLIIVMTCVAIGPAVFFGVKLYNRFEDEMIKKRWIYFIFGTCAFCAALYGTLLANTLNIPIFRTVWGIITLFLAIPGVFLIYYGVVLRFRK